VSTLSQAPGVFPGQTEANPKAHVNVISFEGSKLGDTIAKVQNIEKENVKLLVFYLGFCFLDRSNALEHFLCDPNPFVLGLGFQFVCFYVFSLFPCYVYHCFCYVNPLPT